MESQKVQGSWRNSGRSLGCARDVERAYSSVTSPWFPRVSRSLLLFWAGKGDQDKGFKDPASTADCHKQRRCSHELLAPSLSLQGEKGGEKGKGKRGPDPWSYVPLCSAGCPVKGHHLWLVGSVNGGCDAVAPVNSFHRRSHVSDGVFRP